MNDFDEKLKRSLLEVRDAGRLGADERKAVAKERLMRRVHRRRWVGLGGSAVLAGAAAVGAFMLFSSYDGTQQLAPRPDVDAVRIPEPARAVVEVGQNPTHLSVGGRRYVWVANLGSQSVSRIDPKTNEEIAEVELPAEPGDIAIGKGPVWVALPELGAVAQIDPAGETVAGELVDIADGRPVEDVEMTVGAGALWVVVKGEHVERIDLESRVPTRIEVASSPTDVAVRGELVRVLDAEGRIHQLDSATGEPAAEPLTVAAAADGDITFAAGSIWFFSEDGDVIQRLDPDTGEVLGEIDPEGVVVDFVIDPEVSWVLTRSGAETADAEYFLTPIDRDSTEPAGDSIQIDGNPTEALIAGRSLWLSLTREDLVLRFSKYR
ncbi:MAG TPA: hypothetical protein VJ927_08420 [Actinomycetota bacterium]|nr:hypothetical protein [Actinomycetota bacterium]